MKKESNKVENQQLVNDFKITQYKSIKSSKVENTISLAQAFNMVHTGDIYLKKIENARKHGKGSKVYDDIKTNQLPTFRFNFLFQGEARNGNIISPTGLIYIDVDHTDDVPESDYIYARWRSLSNNGFGILVKVDNLTEDNFKTVYDELSKEIGIDSDAGARKATQQTVLSYDSNLYYNSNSLTYTYIETEKVSSITNKEEEKGIGVNETFCTPRPYKVARFDNIDDYFKGEHADKPYLFFDKEMTAICEPFIPNSIKQGSRNITMFTILANYAALNLHLGYEYLRGWSDSINKKMYPRLSALEVEKIIDNILSIKKRGELYVNKNKKRRLLFNPRLKLPKEEKSKILGRLMGEKKRNDKASLINQVLENWDFKANGKIMQKKVSEVSEIPLSTLKRYWSQFKGYVGHLNYDYGNEK